MYRKIIVLAFALCIACCSLSSCGEKEESITNSSSSVADSSDSDTVEVTLTKDLIPNEETAAGLAEGNEDILSYEINEDGSATYVYKKDAYEKTVENLKQNMTNTIEEVKTSDVYTFITSVDVDENYETVTIHVTNEADYNSKMGSFVVMGLYMPMQYYNAFRGVETPTVTFHLIDDETGEEFDTVVYPEELEGDLSAAEDAE